MHRNRIKPLIGKTLTNALTEGNYLVLCFEDGEQVKCNLGWCFDKGNMFWVTDDLGKLEKEEKVK